VALLSRQERDRSVTHKPGCKGKGTSRPAKAGQEDLRQQRGQEDLRQHRQKSTCQKAKNRSLHLGSGFKTVVGKIKYADLL
jgi:hypothetical protein